jgi:hypothetical protein
LLIAGACRSQVASRTCSSMNAARSVREMCVPTCFLPRPWMIKKEDRDYTGAAWED